MTIRAAIIRSGVVVNCILVESMSHPVDGTLVASDTAGIGDLYDGKTFTRPVRELSKVKQDKAAELRNAHAAAYKSGFTSSALGTAHFYSTDNISNRLTSDQIDRDDLQAAILLAMTNRDVPGWSLVYPCRDAAGWARKSHTAAQIIKVGQDGFVAMQDYNIKLTQLLTQMDAATTVAGVEAVVWG